jgi:hypothetical protein
MPQEFNDGQLRRAYADRGKRVGYNYYFQNMRDHHCRGISDD